MVDTITKNGWLRSWELWFLAAVFAVIVFVFFPVKIGSLALLLTRFFALAGGIYVCSRVFFKTRYHEETPGLKTVRTIGIYIALAGAAVGAGSGAIG
jgi:drug/metabolite transporter superfamily protein YnfA